MTKRYIGTNIIHAKPMTLGQYNEYRGWKIPENEDPNKAGYLVIYSDMYESWSPADVFEEAYIETDEMNFGLASEAMRRGNRCFRGKWNKNHNRKHIELVEPDSVSEMTEPYFLINVNGTTFPWTPLAEDLLAVDWCILD